MSVRLAFLLPHLRPGGAERVVLNYLRALDRDRFEPYLFLGRREGAFLDQLPRDVPVIDLGGGRARGLPPRIARALDRHRIEAAYSATDAMNLALLASRWWGGRRTRRIVSIHTTPSAWFAEAKHPRLRRWLMRHLYPSAGLVAVPTEAIAAELAGFATAILPNPVVDSCIPGPHPGAGLRIVAAGRLVEAKGFDLLVDAAAALAQRGLAFDLSIYGEGPLRGALAERIAAHRLQDCVALPGYQSDPHAIFEGAHLCVVPSRREGFGNVIVEAMAAGVPVLAAACPGPSSLIEHGRNGFLVEPGNAEALTDAMSALLTDAGSREHVVDAGRRTAARYEVQEATRRFEAVVERLIGNKQPAKHPDPGQAVR